MPQGTNAWNFVRHKGEFVLTEVGTDFESRLSFWKLTRRSVYHLNQLRVYARVYPFPFIQHDHVSTKGVATLAEIYNFHEDHHHLRNVLYPYDLDPVVILSGLLCSTLHPAVGVKLTFSHLIAAAQTTIMAPDDITNAKSSASVSTMAEIAFV